MFSSRSSRSAAVLAAVAVVPMAGVPALAKSTVRETLSDFKIAGASSAAHGRVTFKVRNAAQMDHELVVLRTRTKAAKLRTVKGKAVETGRVGEVDVAGGETRRLSVRLRKGHYALICNIGSHYSAGMRKDFNVK